LRAKEI